MLYEFLSEKFGSAEAREGNPSLTRLKATAALVAGGSIAALAQGAVHQRCIGAGNNRGNGATARFPTPSSSRSPRLPVISPRELGFGAGFAAGLASAGFAAGLNSAGLASTAGVAAAGCGRSGSAGGAAIAGSAAAIWPSQNRRLASLDSPITCASAVMSAVVLAVVLAV